MRILVLMRILGHIPGATGLVALMAATSAFAADMPKKAPAAAFSWTGCYMGAHIGGALSEAGQTTVTGKTSDFNTGGFIGGGQIGCDYQFANGWVVGGEGRVAGMTMKHSRDGTVTSFATGDMFASRFTLENDVLASIPARVGYRLADRLLGYVKGGAAITHETADNAFTNQNG